ncbi:MAG: hypothetical protein XXXNARYT_003789 [Candidatus Accumulibacter regalis]|jgi:hypothetical protein
MNLVTGQGADACSISTLASRMTELNTLNE